MTYLYVWYRHIYVSGIIDMSDVLHGNLPQRKVCSSYIYTYLIKGFFQNCKPFSFQEIDVSVSKFSFWERKSHYSTTSLEKNCKKVNFFFILVLKKTKKYSIIPLKNNGFVFNVFFIGLHWEGFFALWQFFSKMKYSISPRKF